MFKKFIIFVFVASMLSFSGCTTIKGWFGLNKEVPPTPPIVLQIEKLDDISKNMASNNGQIGELNKGINDVAIMLQKANPQVTEIGLIKTNSDKIGIINTEDIKNIQKIDDVNKQLEANAKELENLKTQLENNKKEMYQSARKLWMGIIGFLSLVMVGSIFLMANGDITKGLPLLIGSLVSIAALLFISEYVHVIAIASGIGLFIAVMYGAYDLYVHKKALKETVTTMEVAKYEDWTDEMRQNVKLMQSPSTQNAVRNIRNDLKKTGLSGLVKSKAVMANIISSSSSVVSPVAPESK